MHRTHYPVSAKGPTAASLSLLPERKRSQGVHLLSPSRTGAGAAQEPPEDLHCQNDEHQELVEKHRGAVRQFVSRNLAPPHTHPNTPKMNVPKVFFWLLVCFCRLTGYGIHHCFARSMVDPEARPTALCHADYYTMAGIAVATCLALCPAVGLMGRRGGLLTFMIITALASLLQLGLLNCE